jgi:hypothetical protein
MGSMLNVVITNPLCGYEKKFNHHVYLNSHGVDERFVKWCDTNCVDLWGYWFEVGSNRKLGGGSIMSSNISDDDFYIDMSDTKAYMSFESIDDLVKFKLCCLSG